MGFDDAVQAMQVMGSALGAQELRASLQQLSQRPMNRSSMDTRMVSIDDLFLPNLHPSRIGDPPPHGEVKRHRIASRSHGNRYAGSRARSVSTATFHTGVLCNGSFFSLNATLYR